MIEKGLVLGVATTARGGAMGVLLNVRATHWWPGGSVEVLPLDGCISTSDFHSGDQSSTPVTG